MPIERCGQEDGPAFMSVFSDLQRSIAAGFSEGYRTYARTRFIAAMREKQRLGETTLPLARELAGAAIF